MPDGVNAGVDSMQVACCDQPLDPAAPVTHVEQLGERYDSVLAEREARQIFLGTTTCLWVSGFVPSGHRVEA